MICAAPPPPGPLPAGCAAGLGLLDRVERPTGACRLAVTGGPDLQIQAEKAPFLRWS